MKRFVSIVDRALVILCGVLLWGTVVLVIGEVASRVLTRQSLYGSFDLQVLFFTYCAGPLILYTMLHDGHVSVSLFTQKLNAKIAGAVRRAVLFLIAVLSGAVTLNTWPYLIELSRSEAGSGNVFQTPQYIFYLVPAVVWPLLCLTAAIFCIKGINSIEEQ